MRVQKTSEVAVRGIVAFESVMWLTTFMPLILLGCVVAATVHDQNVLRWIPDTILEGQKVPGMRLEGGLAGVEWVVNNEELVGNLPSVLDEAIRIGNGMLLHVSGISARVCLSVFIVDESSGKVVSEDHRQCDTRGPIGGLLDVDRYLKTYIGRNVGIPLHAGSATNGFIGRLVVVGLSVGAEMREASWLLGERYVEYGATAVPRQEVVL